jgi:hypothetical protein
MTNAVYVEASQRNDVCMHFGGVSHRDRSLLEPEHSSVNPHWKSESMTAPQPVRTKSTSRFRAPFQKAALAVGAVSWS